jgi:hypothetical protein
LKTVHEVPPEHLKSVAGTVGGTTGPISGAVTAPTQENHRSRSDDRDREASFGASRGPTTRTHIIDQVGAGVEVTRDDSNTGSDSQSGGRRYASWALSHFPGDERGWSSRVALACSFLARMPRQRGGLLRNRRQAASRTAARVSDLPGGLAYDEEVGVLMADRTGDASTRHQIDLHRPRTLRGAGGRFAGAGAQPVEHPLGPLRCN